MLRRNSLLLIAGVFLFAQYAHADIAPALGSGDIYGPLNGPVFGPYLSGNATLIVFFFIAVLAVGARLALVGLKMSLRLTRKKADAGPPGKHEEGKKKGLGGRLVSEAVFIAIVGVIAAIIAPNFLSFRFNTKSREAISNLGAIRGTQVAYVAEWNFYVGNQPPTPIADRTGKKWWDYWDSGTRFSIIGFAPEGKVYCSYSLEGPDYPTLVEGFIAHAECDFDGDGKVSVYTITSENTDITHSGGRF